MSSAGIDFTSPETTVASAATTNIGTSATRRVLVSGTTTITSFGTTINRERIVRFGGALTLTYNATSLILPTGASITTAAGDVARVESDGSGNWRVTDYMKADGTAMAGGTGAVRYDTTQSLTLAQQKQANANIGASRVLLNTISVTVATATISDSSSFTSDFDDYEIVLENIVPITSATVLQMQMQSGGFYQSTGYLGAGVAVINAGSFPYIGATTYLQLCSPSYGVYNAAPGLSGSVFVRNINQTGAPKPLKYVGGHYLNNGSAYATDDTFTGWWNGGNGAVTGFQLSFSSGNIAYIASGVSRVKVYGLR